MLTAACAAEGFALFRSQRPSVIVCDIGMPVNDGYDFVRWVRGLDDEEGGHTPAAAFTAFTRSEDRVRAVAAGYHMQVSKPAAPDELIDAVSSLAKISR